MGELYLRDVVSRLEGLPPPLEAQESYARQHPKPVPKERVKHHGNARLLIEVDGVTKSANAWSIARGFKPPTVGNRIQCGWHPVVAVLAELGESKADAHWRLGLKATHNHTNKTKAAQRARDKRPAPAVVTAAPERASEAPRDFCVICVKGARIEFDGSHSLTPDRADELALDLIRMASDIRRRFSK